MPIRIDKYLWAVRLFKTRSIATEAIRKGKVLVGGHAVKPARSIAENEVFELKLPQIIRKFRVKRELEKRVGAKLVGDYIEEITPKELLDAYELAKQLSTERRQKGLGRPTKKERRDMDDLFEGWENWEIDEDDLQDE